MLGDHLASPGCRAHFPELPEAVGGAWAEINRKSLDDKTTKGALCNGRKRTAITKYVTLEVKLYRYRDDGT